MKLRDVLMSGGIVLCAAIAFSGAVGFESCAAGDETMIVDCRLGANVRSGPSTQDDILDCLPQGTNVIVGVEKDGWYFVEYGSNTGYIRKDLLEATPSTISMQGGEINMEVDCRLGVNVRKGPGTDHEIIGGLDQGIVITVTGIENNWCMFDYFDQTGYVSGDWLTETDKEPTDLNASKISSDQSARIMTVTCKKGVNLRSDANTRSAILDTIEQGTEVKVTDEKDGWWRVEYNGRIGYVYQQWLTEKE